MSEYLIKETEWTTKYSLLFLFVLSFVLKQNKLLKLLRKFKIIGIFIGIVSNFSDLFWYPFISLCKVFIYI